MSAASRDGTGDAIHLDRIVKRFDGALALSHASLARPARHGRTASSARTVPANRR